jgi:DNA excision repair protein ERCC-2
MRAQVDLERKRITAAIRELAAAGPAERVRGLAVPRLRVELGQEVHRAYRRRRAALAPETFTAEVALSLERAIDGFTAHVRGRADGVLDDAAGLLVEEVKSVALDAPALAALTAEDVPGYALQARFYALCLAARHPARPIRARLVLVSVIDDSERVVEVAFDRAHTEAELDALLRAARAEAEAVRARAHRRARSAAALVFPYAEPRTPQQALLDACAGGLAAGRPVLAEAPTGTGKTVAVLLAGLRHALARDATLYFATAKSTQTEHVARTFSDVAAAAGLPPGALTAVTLRAKDRMCPPGTLQCHPAHCAYLRDYEARIDQSGVLAALAAESAHVDPDTIFARGRSLNLCPFELARDLAAAADLVICDYNHIYDRAAALPPFAERAAGEPRDAEAGVPGAPAVVPAATAAAPIVIVDEAHNLADRARAYDSPRVRRADVLAVRERLQAGAYLEPPEHATRAAPAAPAAMALPRTPASEQLLAAIDELCAALCEHIDTAYENAMRDGRGFVEDTTPLLDLPGSAADLADASPGSSPDALEDAWHALADRAAALLLGFSLSCRLHELVFPRDPLIDLLRAVMHVRALIAARDRALIPFVAGTGAPGGAAVGVCCVDPARRLAAQHRRMGGVVAMSATLAPLDHHRALLGLDSLDPVTIRVPTPFPAEHRCVLIAPAVSTRLRERDRHAPAIARLIEDIVTARPGRYAAYFPSFAFLGRVRALLDLPSESVLVQVPDMPAALRQRLLARMRGRPGPALLLAVTGGVFAEGIDLPGEDLVGAIIVGPSLPAPSFERALMRQYFDEHAEGQGFAHAMLYPAMQRVIQAAGRVLRTPEDRGVIALLDRRFAEPGYLDCLPHDWYRHDPAELITDDVTGRVIEFWAGAGAPDAATPRRA